MPYNVSTSFMTYMYAETDDIVITLHLYDSLICLFFSSQCTSIFEMTYLIQLNASKLKNFESLYFKTKKL